MKQVKVNESTRVVTSNKFIHAEGLQNLKIKERKLLYIAISQCRKTDKKFFEYHLSAKDFAELMEIDASNIYAEGQKISTTLRPIMITYRKIDEHGEYINEDYNLFSCMKYGKNYGFSIKFNTDMTDLLLQLKGNFTQPLLSDFLQMNSRYSISIWHLMQEKMKSKKPYGENRIDFYLSLIELRQVTGTENKFIQISQFKEKVLDKAIREIKDSCGVIVNYSNVKSDHTVIGFDFTAYSKWCPADKMHPVYAGKRKI